MAAAGPAIRGSAIVFTHTDDAGVIHVLRGKESKYLTDDARCNTLTDPVTGAKFTLASFQARQQYTAPAGQALDQATISAKNEFTNRAHAIAAANGGFNIRYDTPVTANAAAPFSFTVNFRYLAPDAKYGIIKGKREGAEDPRLTAKREFYEEVGVNYNEFAFRTTRIGADEIINHGYKLFNSSTNILAVGPVTRDVAHGQILAAIANRTLRRYGEMYDLEFVPMDTIMADYASFNGISKSSITSFRAAFGIAGGSRRKHKSRKHKRASRKHRSFTRARK